MSDDILKMSMNRLALMSDLPPCGIALGAVAHGQTVLLYASDTYYSGFIGYLGDKFCLKLAKLEEKPQEEEFLFQAFFREGLKSEVAFKNVAKGLYISRPYCGHALTESSLAFETEYFLLQGGLWIISRERGRDPHPLFCKKKINDIVELNIGKPPGRPLRFSSIAHPSSNPIYDFEMAIHLQDMGVVESSLKSGLFHPNSTLLSGYYPLHAASQSFKESHDLLLLFLKYGANVNQQDRHGNTALHTAASSANYNAMKILLSNGIDPSIENHTKTSALHILVQSNSQSPLFFEIVRTILTTFPSTINQQDATLATPLHYVCSKPQITSSLLPIFLESQHIIVDIFNSAQLSPLDHLVDQSNIPAITMLLDAGASPLPELKYRILESGREDLLSVFTNGILAYTTKVNGNKISLSCLGLPSLPQNIPQSIKKLDLSHNSLSSLCGLEVLSNITKVDCSHNLFRLWPVEVYELSQLHVL
jgi:ankyrin repeat protein